MQHIAHVGKRLHIIECTIFEDCLEQVSVLINMVKILTYSPCLKSGDSSLTHGDCASTGLLVKPVLLPLHSGRCPVHIALLVYAVYPNWARPSRLILIAAFVSLSSVV